MTAPEFLTLALGNMGALVVILWVLWWRLNKLEAMISEYHGKMQEGLNNLRHENSATHAAIWAAVRQAETSIGVLQGQVGGPEKN